MGRVSILCVCALLLACSARAAPAPLYRREYGSRSDFRIPAEELAFLRSSFPESEGLVIRQKSGEYVKHLALETPRCTARPFVIFAPADHAQAQAVVRLLARYSQPFAVVGGGHDFECGSSSQGALISTRRLLGVRLEGERAVIQAGVRGVEVLQALAAKDRTAVLGGCATVGIVGFLLGGGHNDITSNIYGLGAASVLSAKVVLADGRLVEATRDNQHRDLLWALMGAGGGHLGLVVEVTMRTFPERPAHFARLVLDFGKRPEEARQFVRDWSDHVVEHFPLSAGTHLGSIGASSYYVESMCIDCDLRALYAPLLAQYDGAFVSRLFETNTYAPYYLAREFWAERKKGPLPSYWLDAFLDEPQDADNRVGTFVISAIFGGASPPLGLWLNEHLLAPAHVQVYISDIRNVLPDPSLSSFPYTHAKWCVYFDAKYPRGLTTDFFLARMHELLRVVRALPEYQGSYVNDLSCLLPDLDEYLGPNSPEVKRILDKYDPARLFRRPACGL